MSIPSLPNGDLVNSRFVGLKCNRAAAAFASLGTPNSTHFAPRSNISFYRPLPRESAAEIIVQ
jgi:hypothetical protein